MIFLVKASKSFQAVVFKFSKIMIERETFPSNFQETTLHMIFKGGNGRRKNLTDNRFVHSKPWYPRTVEGLLVVQGLKEPLVNKSSMYQIGGQPKHRAEDLIFKASALWADAFYKSKCPYICLFVCLSVCLFTFEVQFNGLFAPTSRSRMSHFCLEVV